MIVAEVKSGKKEVDMLEWGSRGMLEMTGQALLGCSLNLLVEERHRDFAQAVKEILYVKCLT